MASSFSKTNVHDTSCQNKVHVNDIISTNGEEIHDFLVKILSNILNARVNVERLSDDIVTKYTGTEKIEISESSGKNENERVQENLMDVICSKCHSKGKPFYKANEAKCKKCMKRLVYYCRKCNGMFRTRSIGTYHLMKTCNPKGFYYCLKCSYKSVWKIHVQRHIQAQHNEDSEECVKYLVFKV